MKIGRPKQDLNKWCNTNVDFKFEFLDKECKKPDGLIKYLNNQQGFTFISESKFFNQNIPQDVLLTFQQAILANGLSIYVSLECFNQLKKRFLKYKKEQNEKIRNFNDSCWNCTINNDSFSYNTNIYKR